MSTPPEYRTRVKTMITELILLKLAETLARKHGWIPSRPTLGRLLAKTASASSTAISLEYKQDSSDTPDISAVSSPIPSQPESKWNSGE